MPSKDGYIFKYFIDAKGDVVESLENKFEDLNLTAIYEKIEKVVIFELGSYQVVKYFNKGTVIQNELFELIDGLIYDAKFDFNEFIVLDDVQIVAKEYIIYEIELQTKDNVLVSDYIEGHYIYKNVLENSDNVSVRPYISDEIIVDAIYGEIEFTDNLTTLLIKEGFENRTYTGSSNPNLIKLEYENGVTFVHNELCLTSPNLQILILPETIKLIGFFFYEYCINLETIYFRGESQINCQTGTSYAGGNLKIYFENWCPNGQKFYYNDSSQNELKEIPVYTYVSFDELFK